MAIHKYNTKGEYTADERASEANVSQITGSGEVIIDGNFVVTDNPQDGDALFLDPNNKKVWVKGGADLGTAPTGYTSVGVVFKRDGNKVKVLPKEQGSNIKYLAVWQFAITAISSTSITLKLRMKGDYDNYKNVNVTLTSATINATSAAEISAALDAEGNTGYVGYANHGYWAFYDENSSRIIVQCDLCEQSKQANVQGTGCTIALSVWGDMPYESLMCRMCGTNAIVAGVNYPTFLNYYSTNGTTPSANVSPTDTSQIVKRVCFEDSTNSAYSYCSDIRTAYGTYEKYIEFQMLLNPQKYGVFTLPDGKTLTQQYGNTTAKKKDGTDIYLYPALHYALTYGDDGNGGEKFDSEGLRKGDWYCAGVLDVKEFMQDKGYAGSLTTNAVKQKYNHTLSQIGGTPVRSNMYLCLAQRASVANACNYNGGYGAMYSTSVTNANFCIAIAEIEL